jgi:hypothetical protein
LDPKNLARAARYRQLARAEPDEAKAAILREIADEAERDVNAAGEVVQVFKTGEEAETWVAAR